MLVVERFSNVKVLCVGDVMVDCFVDGAVQRISPESPVPVFSAGARKIYPGGAANVARNIAALGASCSLVGVVGADEQGRHLAAELRRLPNVRPIFITCHDRPTTEKTRYVAQGQHMLRVDREVAAPLPAGVEELVVDAVKTEVAAHDALVLSDYAKGALTDKVIGAAVTAARKKGIPIVVDPKSRDLSRYHGVTIITPNAKEIEAATGIDPTEDSGAVEAASEGMRRAGSEAVLVTRAGKGMALTRRDGPPVLIPSSAREVFDVVGAGDTVVATLTLALGAGNDLEVAARAANVAAGIAVGRRGTATVSQSDLIAELTTAGGETRGLAAAKILQRAELDLRVHSWKRDGLRVGFTNGCFDVLHLGHIRLLRFARQHCDRLVVGLNSDTSVRGLKGPDRPYNAEADRAEVLAALGMVDGLVIFNEETPLALIEQISPDVLVKGADYTIQEIVGANFVLSRGGEVLRCELVPGKSSTDLIRRNAAALEPLL
ncbi:MAG: D-glycero-beta-D-manno-heptose-7-phosphate kinase [Pseudomonadota bacterium]